MARSCCPDTAAETAGAQRTIKLIVSKWVHVKSALPISTEGAVELSPYNPLSEADGKAFQGLKCNDRWSETHDIMTFEFVAPISASRKPFCEAGQFASFDFPDGEGTTLNRTWTISNSPREIARTGKFTISVKKVGMIDQASLHECSCHENAPPAIEEFGTVTVSVGKLMFLAAGKPCTFYNSSSALIRWAQKSRASHCCQASSHRVPSGPFSQCHRLAGFQDICTRI